MKIRDSGMPDESFWESLFDVPLILDRLGIGPHLADVAELGCGYGTFTLAVARRIIGRVLTFDIDVDMVRRTRERAGQAGLNNVICEHRDVEAEGYGLPAESVDGFLLFNILHAQRPVNLLRQAAQAIRPGGWIWAIHWRYDPGAPRGPAMAIRPQPEQIAHWAEQTSLLRPDGPLLQLPPWHYGWRLRKRAAISCNSSGKTVQADV